VVLRDLEELLAERGIEVDPLTIYPWVKAFTAEFIGGGRPARHATAVDDSPTKPTSRSPAAGCTCTQGVDQHGQVIDILMSERRDGAAARAFLTRAEDSSSSGRGHHGPCSGHPRVIDELVPAACLRAVRQ
jgi:transposase, IS6 family